MQNDPKKNNHIAALNTVVTALEPLSMEERKKVVAAASAFLLENSPAGAISMGEQQIKSSAGESSNNIGQIINKNKDLRPGQKAAVIAYYLLKKNGAEEFKLDDLKKVYADIGVTPPDRMDMTLKAAFSKGNKLFKTVGRNCYGLTFHGKELAKQANSEN